MELFKDAVVSINENGQECDYKGRYKRDYMNMSIPYEELAFPRNAHEYNERHKRLLIEQGLPVELYKYEQYPEDGDN